MGRMATRMTSATVSGRKRPLKSGGGAQRKELRPATAAAAATSATLVHRVNPKASRKKVKKAAKASDVPAGSTSANQKRNRHWVCYLNWTQFNWIKFKWKKKQLFEDCPDTQEISQFNSFNLIQLNRQF